MAETILIRRGGDAAQADHDGSAPRPHPISILRIALSLLMSLVPPIGAFILFHGGGPLGWVVAYLLVAELLALYRYLRIPHLQRVRAGTAVQTEGSWHAGFRKAAEFLDRLVPWLLGAVLVFGALVVFISLDITPASAFLAWFALVAHGTAGGSIAYMFVVMFTFFSAVFAGAALLGDPLFALSSLAAVDLFVWGVVHGERTLSVGAVVLFLLAVGYLAFRRLGRISTRSTFGILQVAFITALVSLPLSAAAVRNGAIDGLFSLHFNGVVAALFPNFPFLYNAPGYGNSFASTLLGQRPDLTSRPVFEVTGPPGATIYLRTGVYDVYAGTGWKLSDYERRRGILASYYYEFGPGAQSSTSTKTISVKLLADFYDSLPNTLDTVGFHFPAGRTPALSFGSLASGFVLQAPITRGTVTTDLIDTAPFSPIPAPAPVSVPGIHRPRGGYYGEGDGDGDGDGGGYWGFGRAHWGHYGQLDGRPDWLRRADIIPSRSTISPQEEKIDLETGKLPKEVVALAAQLRRPTEQQTIASIRSYLQNNYQYSLSTTAAGPAGDSVDDFLFHSKTGYCVQFATAFAVLARLDAIPSRYVTGFLVYLPQKATSTVVTGLSAHAWAEVWTPSAGWTTIEATPPMIAAASGVSDPQFYAQFNPTGSSETKRELEAVLGNRVPIDAATSGQLLVRHHTAGERRYLWIVPSSLGGGILLALASILLVSRRRRRASAEVRLKRLLVRITRRSRGRDLPDPSHRGWSAWASALARRHPDRRAIAMRAGSIILNRSFGGQSHNGRDLLFLEGLCRWAFVRRASGLSKQDRPSPEAGPVSPVSARRE